MSAYASRGLRIAGVPVLVAEPIAARREQSLPTVLWFHGFRADALAHAAELERCAAAGFLAVGIDAVGHGARRDGRVESRLAASSGGALPVVLELIDETLHELPALIDALVSTHEADRARISAVGISMGAFLVYRAISAASPAPTPLFRSGVALLGSPEWDGSHSAHTRLDAFAHVPLLSITAEHDVSVPPEPAGRFHAGLADRYGSSGAHAHHVLRGAGHLTSAREWAEAMAVTMHWLDRFAR